MTLREMTLDEKTIRLAIATIQRTIDDLCLQRNTLAAMLPNAPRPRRMTHIGGIEIKPGGGKKRKKIPDDE